MSSQLNINQNFEVRGSNSINLFFGVIMLIIGTYALLTPGDAVNNSSIYFRYSYYTNMVFIIPGAFFLLRAFFNKTTLKINRKGIFSHGILITNWQNYLGAFSKQEPPPGSIKDCEILYLKYRKNGKKGIFVRKIKMSSSNNKTSHEIIEAIEFYYTHSIELNTK